MNNKMCLVYLGAFLLAVHLISSPVVQAQNTTTDNMNQTMTYMVTMMPNSTMNTTKDNGCGRSAASSLLQLLPLAVAASLLHGWS